ncbi:MAG: asparagine synthase-related protein [Sphingomonadaceae bacterium]
MPELVRALSVFGAQATAQGDAASGWCTAPPAAIHSEAGWTVAFHGWIDNPQQIGSDHSLPAARLYALALARWGEEADQYLIGNYCSVALGPDGALRLARSPWNAPPLHYARNGERAVASPLLRALFAAGVPKQLDYDRLADELAFDFHSEDGSSWYRDLNTVPLGAVVTLRPGAQVTRHWYDPAIVPLIRHADERDYVAQACHLLDEAADKALVGAGKPAIALSGGLDSPLVAEALLRCLPEDRQLEAITFIPDPDWDGEVPPGIMGNELDLVERIAAMHPRLSLHVADPADGGFDRHARDMFRAMDSFGLGLANVGMYHGVYARARALGCDTIFNADLGNQSFSDDGRWAYVEYAKKGQWGQLAKLLRNRPGDARPLWRKVLALSVLPLLPAGARNALRGMVHPARRDMTALLSPLSPAALASQRETARLRGSGSAWDDYTHARSRREAARYDHESADRHASNITLAFEQIYGLRIRDVTAYRPLIEFCLGLPTCQFAWDGEERRLARRMAQGRMPEPQRLETRHGFHNIDMHTRIGRRREELAAYCAVMREHPYLSRLIDIERIEQLLANWPEKSGLDIEQDWPRIMAIPRAVLAAQFIAHVEGRNDL